MSKLFQPLEVAGCHLQHRMVMAPLTRFRADDDYIPTDIMKEYYTQRASVPGTLLVTEGTQISKRSIGIKNVPGIWSSAQIAAWREITDAVHAKGSYIWCQFWVLGRASNPALRRELGLKLLGPSPVASSLDRPLPEEMSEEEIQEVIEDHRIAARNAIEAGFDGIEIQGGGGYLPDQFLQDVTNKRTDHWGGSIENRARFPIEVTKAISQEIGSRKVAIRLSPWSDFMGMGMDDPIPTFTYLVRQLRNLDIGFLDLIEARIRGNDDADCGGDNDVSFAVHAWGKEAPVMVGGGFNSESAQKAVDKTYKGYKLAMIFGRHWTSNPDLPFRVKMNIPLVKYDRSTFYTPKSSKGYNDWAFSEELLALGGAARLT
ncbi:Chanoclavine-I aldehyde reductase easA [Talaromyces pinophilus]|nr:Chanoclavine-I aldehyde reductase easA [Talaromyces pinophilus]